MQAANLSASITHKHQTLHIHRPPIWPSHAHTFIISCTMQKQLVSTSCSPPTSLSRPSCTALVRAVLPLRIRVCVCAHAQTNTPTCADWPPAGGAGAAHKGTERCAALRAACFVGCAHGVCAAAHGRESQGAWAAAAVPAEAGGLLRCVVGCSLQQQHTHA